MIQTCDVCDTKYDDEFRSTLCPHAAFFSNDGENNFLIRDDSFVEPRTIPVFLSREEIDRIQQDFATCDDLDDVMLPEDHPLLEYRKQIRKRLMDKLS